LNLEDFEFRFLYSDDLEEGDVYALPDNSYLLYRDFVLDFFETEYEFPDILSNNYDKFKKWQKEIEKQRLIVFLQSTKLKKRFIKITPESLHLLLTQHLAKKTNSLPFLSTKSIFSFLMTNTAFDDWSHTDIEFFEEVMNYRLYRAIANSSFDKEFLSKILLSYKTLRENFIF